MSYSMQVVENQQLFYLLIIEMKDTGQDHQYVMLQDPNNSLFIRRFQVNKKFYDIYRLTYYALTTRNI